EEGVWRPIQPVPADAPELMTRYGRTVQVFNPKRAGERFEHSSWKPAMLHPYRAASGELLGFVLRVVSAAGGKFTPTVTFCENRRGERRWCIVPFNRPTPLYGLDQLVRRPAGTVVLAEGEKTAEVAARLFSSFVSTTWPGGSKAYSHVDLSPLRGRRVICIPDADQPGREAFIGWQDRRGRSRRGLIELLADAGAATRLADPEPTRPDGWDIADAEAEGWKTAQAVDWLKSRLAGCLMQPNAAAATPPESNGTERPRNAE